MNYLPSVRRWCPSMIEVPANTCLIPRPRFPRRISSRFASPQHRRASGSINGSKRQSLRATSYCGKPSLLQLVFRHRRRLHLGRCPVATTRKRKELETQECECAKEPVLIAIESGNELCTVTRCARHQLLLGEFDKRVPGARRSRLQIEVLLQEKYLSFVC